MGYPDCQEPGKVYGCPHGGCSVYTHNNSVAVWSSPDLSDGSWTLLDQVYPSNTSGVPRCTYFRTQGVFNPHTKLYVLWANVAGCAHGIDSQAYMTATSRSPGGPFTFTGFTEPNQTALGPKLGGLGDFALFVDDDGKAYAILTHLVHNAGARDMYVFALADDFLSFGAQSVGPLPGQKLVEAPALFKRGSTYFALLGGCTCMGLYGGGVNVLTAPSPLGPWANGSATIDPGCPMWRQTSCFQMGPGQICDPVTQAQQNYVITVPLANGDTAHVWTGDKWQQAPNGRYAQQPQTLVLLDFEGDTLLPFTFRDNFTLDVAV